METAKEWREFYQHGRGPRIATVQRVAWLLEGCPMCGGKAWLVTNDCWAYCVQCDKGYPTAYEFTRKTLTYVDGYGYHCFLCSGYGTLADGEVCDECHGRVTQPEPRPHPAPERAA